MEEQEKEMDNNVYMPNYISKNLSKDEKILVAEQTCKWLYVPICGICLFLVIILMIAQINSEEDLTMMIVFFAIFALWYWFSNRAREMAVTNKRVIFKKGIFIHNTDELRLEKVESTNIKKSLLGLVFGYGTIMFTGTGNKVIKFEGIDNPQKIKNEIDNIFDKYGK